jgi:hypothetical protein
MPNPLLPFSFSPDLVAPKHKRLPSNLCLSPESPFGLWGSEPGRPIVDALQPPHTLAVDREIGKTRGGHQDLLLSHLRGMVAEKPPGRLSYRT